MESARKSYELQKKVQHNVNQMQSALEDMYSWQKEMKDREKHLLEKSSVTLTEEKQDNSKKAPIRSELHKHKQKPNMAPNTKGRKSEATLSFDNADAPAAVASENKEVSIDSEVLARKQANEIKERGNKHARSQEFQLAIDDYSAAIQLVANEPAYYTNRAFCLLKLERYQESTEDCEKAIALDKLNVKAYYRRMQANEGLGNNLDALKDCTTVLTIDPKNGDAKRALERINDRIRENQKSRNCASFTPLLENLIDIAPIDKPAYKRSSQPLHRVPVIDIVGPQYGGNENILKISDNDLDKLFNSNCGEFVEVKKEIPKETSNDVIFPPTAFEDVASTAYKSFNENKTTATTKANSTIENTEKEKTLSSHTKNNNEAGLLSNDKKEIEKLTKPQKDIKNSSKVDEKTEMRTVKPLPPRPITAPQFTVNWKELDADQKYQYLKTIELNVLPEILGTGFDSDTFTDIIRVLHQYYMPNKDVKLAETLLAITQNNQFKILSLFLSTEDRKAISDIINFLKESGEKAECLEKIESLYNRSVL